MTDTVKRPSFPSDGRQTSPNGEKDNPSDIILPKETETHRIRKRNPILFATVGAVPTGRRARHPPRHTRFIAEIRSACRLFIRQCRHHQHRQNTLPHGLLLSPFTDKKREKPHGFLSLSSGGRTRTSDLWVMSPTSCQLLHPAMYRIASTALNRLFGNPRTVFPAAFLFLTVQR